MPITHIRIHERFCAALALRDPNLDDQENARLFGKWTETHGHDFDLEVVVAGPLHAKTRCIMDYTALHRLVRRVIINKIDHKCLNTLEMFAHTIPTAEIMTNIFFERLAQSLPRAIRLVSLTLCDGDGNATIVRNDTDH